MLAFKCDVRVFSPEDNLPNILSYMKENEFSQVIVMLNHHQIFELSAIILALLYGNNRNFNIAICRDASNFHCLPGWRSNIKISGVNLVHC